jgi:hypothetical protein
MPGSTRDLWTLFSPAPFLYEYRSIVPGCSFRIPEDTRRPTSSSEAAHRVMPAYLTETKTVSTLNIVVFMLGHRETGRDGTSALLCLYDSQSRDWTRRIKQIIIPDDIPILNSLSFVHHRKPSWFDALLPLALVAATVRLDDYVLCARLHVSTVNPPPKRVCPTQIQLWRENKCEKSFAECRKFCYTRYSKYAVETWKIPLSF